ncbi:MULTISPECIES: hypothetical protein [Pontibacter]|uniref:Uncharacterized protein n=1 Tax=Pontibacter lucknowensis TaxID=1077936 RepID=A0A1N6UUN1_9BACT|nr:MULTISPECIES: hypothetical protein [Pontibacter]EJF09616.1 hypothetical protein O71_13931 [Pontibacter sp. BAB1700]SIQ69333.1 hypothetical protein SAMN05421545_1087 [Pontibacter lucknowensis]
MAEQKSNRLYGLFFFIVFEVLVFYLLSNLVSGMGIDNQYQAENTIVPNWVKAVTFILLYILCVLIAVVFVSNVVPSKHRGQLMSWVYLALAGMLVMLALIF